MKDDKAAQRSYSDAVNRIRKGEADFRAHVAIELANAPDMLAGELRTSKLREAFKLAAQRWQRDMGLRANKPDDAVEIATSLMVSAGAMICLAFKCSPPASPHDTLANYFQHIMQQLTEQGSLPRQPAMSRQDLDDELDEIMPGASGLLGPDGNPLKKATTH